MPQFVPPIREFPKDGRVWRVDWFGAIERNENVPSEPAIEVILSPARDGIEAPRLQEDFEDKLQTVRRIGVGQLPFVTIGLLWRNGRILRQMAGELINLSDIQVNSATVALIAADAQDGPGRWVIPPFRHKVSSHGLRAKCLAISYGGDPYGILLPATEAIRFYYAASTDLALAVFYGAYSHDLNLIVNPDLCGFLPERKRCIVHLRKWLSDDDGWIIGRILNDERAFHGARLVHDSLMRDRSNREPRIYPETALPFEGQVTWQTRAIRIPVGGKYRYLIFTLRRCSGPFPYQELEVSRDNDNQKAENPEDDVPEEEKRPAWGYPKSRAVINAKSELQSGSEPKANVEPAQISLPEERFVALQGKKVIRTPKEQCQYKSGTLQRLRGLTTSDSLGTGGGDYTETAALPVEAVSAPDRQKPLRASFDVTLNALAALNEYPDYSAVIREPGDAICFMPLTRASKYHQWSYLNSALKQRRLVLVADIYVMNRLFCLIEFEQRESERFAVGLITRGSGETITDSELEKLLMSLAMVKGVWGSVSNLPFGLFHQKLHHVWSSAEDYAEAVKAKIEALIQI